MEKSCHYSKVHTNDEWVVEPEAVCICSASSSSSSSKNQYPGMRRQNTAGPAISNKNPDIVLVKTGGNALKAISRQEYNLQMQQNNNINNNHNPTNVNAQEETVLSVVVPANMKSGDALHVQEPDGRLIAVTIPSGLFPGQSFMVKVPPPTTHASHLQQQQQHQPVVASHAPPSPPPTDSIPFSQALNSNYATTTTTTSTTSNHNNYNTTNDDGDLILVRVPAGYGPGSKLHVQVPSDGRLVEATVPSGNVTEFYMRLPPTTNMPVARPIFP